MYKSTSNSMKRSNFPTTGKSDKFTVSSKGINYDDIHQKFLNDLKMVPKKDRAKMREDFYKARSAKKRRKGKTKPKKTWLNPKVIGNRKVSY